MNAYRDLISACRELARLARAAGLNVGTLRVVDLAQDAERQLARDATESYNLRTTLEDLFYEPPVGPRCGSCGRNDLGAALRAHSERKARAEHELRRVLERLGGPKAPVLPPNREARVQRELVDFYEGGGG